MINIVLFQPEIPQNTGNIIRTAMAIGGRLHLIKPLGFSLEEKSLLRASMDYIKEVEIIQYDSYEDFLIKNPNITIYYVTRYANKSYSEYDLSDPSEDYYFMFGRESSGVPEEVHNAHKGIRMPMIKTSTRSLNLSNTVCAIAYEALRQMDFPNMK